MKNRMRLITFIMGGVLILLLTGAVVLYALRGVHQLTLRNDLPVAIEDLVVVWPERRTEWVGSLPPGKQLLLRHPVAGEGRTRLYFTRNLAGKRQVEFVGVDEYMTPHMDTQGLYVFQ